MHGFKAHLMASRKKRFQHKLITRDFKPPRSMRQVTLTFLFPSFFTVDSDIESDRLQCLHSPPMAQGYTFQLLLNYIFSPLHDHFYTAAAEQSDISQVN